MEELPCLALHHRDRSTSLFSASNETLIVDGNADELLGNKTIYPTVRGLILVRNPDTMTTSLWNPSHGGQVHLPPLQGVDNDVLMHSHCLLSDEPSAPGCVMVVLEAGNDTFLWYCQLGDDDQWNKYDYDIGSHILSHYPEEYEKSMICPIAARRGKFYFNSSPSELGVLEFSLDPVISFIAIEDDDDSNDGYFEDGDDRRSDDEDDEGEPPDGVFLVESGGELYVVTLLYATMRGNEIDDALVDRWDFSERQWRGVDDLCGRTFLLSLFHFGASCSSGADDHELQKDCIYIVYPRNKEMLIIDVKEGTNYMHKLDEAPAADKAFWLLPVAP
ncbi:unnamed protein product [Urochloa humidicola]